MEKFMRRLFVGMLALAASVAMLSSATFAADLAPFTKAPAVPGFSWTGYYLGLNAGVGAQDTNVDRTASGILAGLFPADANARPHGWLYGGQIGYNHQLGKAVVGIEADFDWTNFKGQNFSTATLGGLSANTSASQKLDWLSTVRARLGFLPFSHVLVYATGGLAIGKVETNVSSTFAPGCIIGCGAATNGATKTGWTLGGGIEAALDRNWSVKAEALYYDLGNVSGAYTAPGIVPTSFAYNSEYRGGLGRLGINYRF
jgi:outer membrane immunogenic protein